MINKGSVRRKSVETFRKVIELRKKEYSYSEIRKETGVAKSTINNWLTLAGLTLSKEHLQIQAKKRAENHVIGTAASKVTRARRKEAEIQTFIQSVKEYFNDPFFIGGVMLYEAEGAKGSANSFSNSDFRLIAVYIKFLEKYFTLNKNENFRFRLYIHELRKNDKERILDFWSKKLAINKDVIRLSWKHNKVTKRRFNLNYVGQFETRVIRYPFFFEKLSAISDIILSRYLRP
jgi:hypothetical protein